MSKVLNFSKKTGETMGQLLSRIKEENGIKKIGYTARLDPMAKGLVPFVIDDECANIKMHLSANKTYQVKIIFGIQTDTDDLLGLITKKEDVTDTNRCEIIYSIIEYMDSVNHTKFNQKYHHYSTKMLNHRKHKHTDIVDEHEVSIFNYFVLASGKLDFDVWKNKAIERIKSIDPKNNFRQESIIKQWDDTKITDLYYLKLEIKVSSGFFIRQLIRDMSTHIKYPLMCYNINRVSFD